jgi:hypothetical protein
MANRLGSKTTQSSVPRDDGQDGLSPISERLYEWALPFVWFVLAVVLLAGSWF